MDDYRPNSHKYKEEQTSDKKVEKVVSGKVKTRKKTGVSKVADVFVAEDVKNVKTYILMDVLVPTIKKAVIDIVSDGIRMLLNGDTVSERKRSTNASYISYNRYSDRREDRYRDSSRARVGYNYDEIVLESRGEAEEVLARMSELIDAYGIVSVADLYDLVGVTGNYTDNKYGWTSIRTAEAIRLRGGEGYMLKLPKALPID